MKFIYTAILCLLLFSFSACTSEETKTASTITVSAASDLIPAFEAIKVAFEAETGMRVIFNFGSSGQLAQQIEQGAPVDVFASANRHLVTNLVQSGHILAESVAPYAVGHITIWTRSDSLLEITDLSMLTDPRISRIAIANPAHAPYGTAAREALENSGIWNLIQDKLVFGNNVRETLQFAETGNVDVAIVALSLSTSSDGRWILIPETLHNPIEQVMGIVSTTENPTAAAQFVAFVRSAAGIEILEQFGFALPEADS